MKRLKEQDNKKAWICQEDILCGVKRPGNKEHLSGLEDEHLISIFAQDAVRKNEYFEVRIDMGSSEKPPAEPAHFIEWVELYAGDTFLGRTHFSAGVSYPLAVFKVKLTHAQGPLKVWAKCNLHGLWAATKAISAD